MRFSLLVVCRVGAPGIGQRQYSTTPLTQSALSSPLRILHLTAPARAGGLESVVRLLARGQQSAGHQVLVVAVVGEQDMDHPFVAALASDGIASETVRLGARSYAREWRTMRALFAEWKPDVVHTHGYRSDVMGGLAASSMKIPRVTTVHGFTGGGLKNRLNEWAQVRSYRSFTAVAAVSNTIAQRLASSRVPARLIHTIPNAIDATGRVEPRTEARRRLCVSDNQFVIGWVGRMSSEKGLDVLIDALTRVKKPFKAIFVGDGPSKVELTLKAESLGIASSILWPGVVPEASGIFSAFDAFVLSSRTEGIPIVLLEAMRARIPIVSTRVGGVPEMLSETEAVLVDPERPEALAAGIEAVRRDPVATAARVEAARARLDRDFTVQPWVERYDALYGSVIPMAGRGAR